MTDFKKDMVQIQTLVGNAFSATGGLVALANGGVMNGEKLQQTLENGGSWYRQRQAGYGYPTMGSGNMCMKLCVANMICNMCCCGRGFFCI